MENKIVSQNNKLTTLNGLTVVYVNSSEILPAEYNPRHWNDKQMEDLKESIRRFNQVDPLILNSAPNRKNRLVGGNMRLEALKQLGYKTVACVYVNIPDLEKEKELNIRLNANTGSWNFEILKSFDVGELMEIGFDDNELSHIWDENLSVEDDGFDVEKELEKIKKPKTKPEDLIRMGEHLLICGDSTDPEVVKRLTQENAVTMVYCDPPFNIGLNYDTGIGGKKNYGGNVNDRKSPVEYKTFLNKTIENGLLIAKPSCHVFYYCDESCIGLLQEIYRELGITNKRVCLWIKNNSNLTPQIAFNKVYEACCYGVVGKPFINQQVRNLNEILNKEVTSGNRLIDDILDLLNIWLVKRLPTQTYEHPTEKPPSLHEKALRRCTRPGDMVLDLFAGSGSSMVACDQLKRTCFMVEKEPIFCDLIVKRYQALTGKEAIYGH